MQGTAALSHTHTYTHTHLVITDEPNMVHNMTDLGPFPGSDHSALCWQLEFNTKEEVLCKQSLNYSKMDVTVVS